MEVDLDKNTHTHMYSQARAAFMDKYSGNTRKRNMLKLMCTIRKHKDTERDECEWRTKLQA